MTSQWKMTQTKKATYRGFVHITMVFLCVLGGCKIHSHYKHRGPKKILTVEEQWAKEFTELARDCV